MSDYHDCDRDCQSFLDVCCAYITTAVIIHMIIVYYELLQYLYMLHQNKDMDVFCIVNWFLLNLLLVVSSFSCAWLCGG